MIVKILHTIGAAGLMSGVACYMLLLVWDAPETASAYADLRSAIAGVCNYVVMPSLAMTLISGLLSMVVHTPFLDKGWAWLKALTGILMFQAVLVLIVGEANTAAAAAQRIADGDLSAGEAAFHHDKEMWTLGVVMVIAVANVVLGVWRPRLMKPAAPQQTRPANEGAGIVFERRSE